MLPWTALTGGWGAVSELLFYLASHARRLLMSVSELCCVQHHPDRCIPRWECNVITPTLPCGRQALRLLPVLANESCACKEHRKCQRVRTSVVRKIRKRKSDGGGYWNPELPPLQSSGKGGSFREQYVGARTLSLWLP